MIAHHLFHLLDYFDNLVVLQHITQFCDLFVDKFEYLGRRTIGVYLVLFEIPLLTYQRVDLDNDKVMSQSQKQQ
jgi:hypothetical protein